jgi:hypothetical protein
LASVDGAFTAMSGRIGEVTGVETDRLRPEDIDGVLVWQIHLAIAPTNWRI